MNKQNRIEIPLCLAITDRIFEGEKTATFSFHLPANLQLHASPGQYFMLWLPGDDEIPISISQIENNEKIQFTICSKGQTSANFLRMNKGDLIGLRGPYGNGFDISDKEVAIIIAGGMGIAPLRFLISSLFSRTQEKIILIHGARTHDDLFFKEELINTEIDLFYCTDDGSFGFHGLPTIILEEILQKTQKEDLSYEIYSCGPEKMLKGILDIAKKFHSEKNAQFSLADRYIRCGFGICGSCYLDDVGLSICRDGPVFRGDVLQKITDFGLLGRNARGAKYPL
ncbi:MAG: dihydroorotate dehydrogenase electron transfer subunit [Candidatus Hodarchaeales archaeon]